MNVVNPDNYYQIFIRALLSVCPEEVLNKSLLHYNVREIWTITIKF